MPVVRRAARFAGQPAATATEPRRSLPPNAAHFPATDVSLITVMALELFGRRPHVDFVVIRTRLHFVFDRTQNNQAFDVHTAASDGRSAEGLRLA
jgi:hypothetical protein